MEGGSGGSGSEEEAEVDEEHECTGGRDSRKAWRLSRAQVKPAFRFRQREPAASNMAAALKSGPCLRITKSRHPPADAAWVRYSAVCGLLRLARAYDSAMPASLYANLALTFQAGPCRLRAECA